MIENSKIIDAHCHMFDIYGGFDIARPIDKIPLGLLSILELLGFRRPGGNGKSSSRWLGDRVFVESCKRMQLCRPESYLDYFNENGIAAGVLMPVAPQVPTEKILSVCQLHKRLVPFASVDFKDRSAAEKLEHYMEQGCRGLKIHPVLQSIHPQAEAVYQVLEAFGRYQLPVCIHVGPCRAGIIEVESELYAAPHGIEKLISDFKNIPFILAHMGLQYHQTVIQIAKSHENIYLDTSFQPARILKKAESAVGCRRIVFGTDFPLLNPSAVIRVVKKAFRSVDALENVFYKNIASLINIAP